MVGEDLDLIPSREGLIRFDGIVDAIEGDLEVSSDLFHTSDLSHILLDSLGSIWIIRDKQFWKEKGENQTRNYKNSSLKDRESRVMHDVGQECDDRTGDREGEAIEGRCHQLDDEKEYCKGNPKVEWKHREF